jgi:HAD superfamily hydrolase (TIGR01450 family)
MTQTPAAVADAQVWIVDLDGVLWLAGEPIGDVASAVTALRDRGVRVVFATNNSAPTTEQLVARLARVGIAADPDDLVTSARVAASLLEPGQRVHLLGEAGLVEALVERGVEVADAGPRDAAVVGWSRDFDFAALAAIAAVARATGRLIATNGDPTHPTPEGLLPGSGALLAAVATASGVDPVVAGKPHPPTVGYIRDRMLGPAGDRPAVVVGDQPGTDGALAERLGLPFVLVDSGVTAPGAPVDGVPVALRCADFVSLVAGLPPARVPSS